jgi:hypothetical protein
LICRLARRRVKLKDGLGCCQAGAIWWRLPNVSHDALLADDRTDIVRMSAIKPVVSDAAD